MQKMSVQAPPKLLVEKYLIEIAKIYNVDYEPDPKVNLTSKTNMISLQNKCTNVFDL
jgi:vacuolar protein sorting-associated protein IST1